MQGMHRRVSVALLGLALGAAGCASRITNLTPTVQPKSPTGLYTFEAEWTSNQRTRELERDAIQAYVVIDQKFYPMAPVPRMPDRWETRVPIEEGQSPVFYYYKWDYRTAGFGRTNPNSIRSQTYRLELVDGRLGQP
jgi:hypothetical protein